MKFVINHVIQNDLRRFRDAVDLPYSFFEVLFGSTQERLVLARRNTLAMHCRLASIFALQSLHAVTPASGNACWQAA